MSILWARIFPIFAIATCMSTYDEYFQCNVSSKTQSYRDTSVIHFCHFWVKKHKKVTFSPKPQKPEKPEKPEKRAIFGLFKRYLLARLQIDPFSVPDPPFDPFLVQILSLIINPTKIAKIKATQTVTFFPILGRKPGFFCSKIPKTGHFPDFGHFWCFWLKKRENRLFENPYFVRILRCRVSDFWRNDVSSLQWKVIPYMYTVNKQVIVPCIVSLVSALFVHIIVTYTASHW